MGGFIRLLLNPERVPVGASVGPAAVAFYRFADAQLGTAIGPLAPAPDIGRPTESP
jgi:hypothetical protein